MAQAINTEPFTSISDSFGDAPLFTAPLEIESINLDHRHYALPPFPNLVGPAAATPGYQYGLVQSVELPPAIGVPSHNLRPDELPQSLDLTGPYSAMDHRNYSLPAPSTGTVRGIDPPHLTADLAEHHGDQAHDGGYHTLIGPGPPRLGVEYHAPVVPDLNNDDPLVRMFLLDNIAGPPQGGPSPVRSRISDGESEDLKRLASQYLNNPNSYVNDFHVRRRLSGGREVLILLEIDD